jgi:D-alanine-D-alanine ligase
VAEAAVVAHETLGLGYLSRIDFIIDDSGQPVFLEANALPGLTETSSAPLAIESAGLNVAELFDGLARLGISRAAR